MKEYLFALGFIALLGGFYALVYYLNHKTPVPKGCEHLKAACDGCKIVSCENNPTHDYTKGEN